MFNFSPGFVSLTPSRRSFFYFVPRMVFFWEIVLENGSSFIFLLFNSWD